MRKLVEQFLKFGVVGTIAFLIDYGLLMVLSQFMGVDAVVAGAISFCVSVVFNYFASMRYVFTRREDMSRKREFFIFVALSVVGLVINEIIIAAGVGAFGDEALTLSVIKVVATFIVTWWNFFSRKKWLEAH